MADEIIIAEDAATVLPDRKPRKIKEGASVGQVSESETKRAHVIMDRFRNAQKARTASGIEDEWAEAERLYNQEDDLNVEGEWRSDAFVPHATREVHNATPHLVSAILDADRLVSVTAPDPAADDYAKLEERVLEYQLEQKMQFPDVLEIWAKQTVMLGTSVSFVGFKKVWEEVEQVVQQQVAPDISTPKIVKQRVVTDAYNVLYPLDITDIWVDPSSTPLYIPRLWYYERKSIRQMRDSGIPYTNLDKLPSSPVPMKEFFRADFQQDDGVAIGSRRDILWDDDADLDPEDRLHHLVHEWDDERKIWSVIADNDIEILRERKFKKLPFVFSWYEFVNTRFYGRGVVAGVAKSCRNANRLRRQRDDNVELCLSKMFVVKRGAIVDEQKELIWGPGRAIHVQGGTIDNSIKVLEMGDVTASAYQDERIIKNDIEEVNGISNVAVGKSDPSSRTATGTSILRQMAVLRLRGPIRHMLQSMLRVIDLMADNNQRYLSPLDKSKLLGVSARLYEKYNYNGQRVVLNIHPASLYDNSEVKTGQLMTAINIMGGLGLLTMLDPRKLALMVMKKVADVDDTDELFLPSEQSYTAPEFMQIMAEIHTVLRGEKVPVTPEQNHKARLEMAREFMRVHPEPEVAQFLLPYLQQHEQMQQQLALMAAAAAAPAAPQRLPQATSDEGANRSSANSAAAAAQRPSEAA